MKLSNLLHILMPLAGLAATTAARTPSNGRLVARQHIPGPRDGTHNMAKAKRSLARRTERVVTSIKSNGQTTTMTITEDDSSGSTEASTTSTEEVTSATASERVVTSIKSNGQTVTMTITDSEDGAEATATVSAGDAGQTPNVVAAPDICTTGSDDTDLLVLTFANLLEELETQFYIQGLAKFSQTDMQKAGLSAAQAQIVVETLTVIANDENQHAIALKAAIKALGGEVKQPCGFDFSAALSSPAVFLATAQALELVGVSAYEGGAALVKSRSILTAALSIHSIEARHQTTLNILNAATFVPQAFDMALTPPQVLALAGGFLTGCTADDLGLTSNQPLSVRNAKSKATVFSTGDSLTFTSNIDASADSVFCALLVGGASQAVTMPLKECKIPEHVDGPVYVYLTSDATPLAADINVQDASTMLAGPGLIFVDGSASLLQDLFTVGDGNNGNGNNGNGGKKGGNKNGGKSKGSARAGADLGYAGVCKNGGLNSNGTWYDSNPMSVEQTVGIGCTVLGFETVSSDQLAALVNA